MIANPGTHPLRPAQVGKTLVDQLGPIADSIRQLATDFGLRPYRCFLVRIKWSGKNRGEGEQEIVSRDEILPTPRIKDTTRQVREVNGAGVQEIGGVTLERVTMRLSEDRILGRDGGKRPPKNEQVFIEIVEDGSVTPAARRRRFAVRNVPFLKRGGTSWTVPLERQYQDLDRDGQPVANP